MSLTTPRTTEIAPPRHRRRLLAIALIVVMALLAGGYFVYTRVLGADEDPSRVELPAPATGVEARALQDYLEGAGQPLVAFVAALSTDLGAESVDHCSGLVARLQSAGTPRELSDLAEAVPERVVRDAARGTLAATVRFIEDCFAGVPSDEIREGTEFQRLVLERMLEQYGIRP